MRRILKSSLIFLLLFMSALSCATAGAATEGDRQERLTLQSYLFWQGINEARRDPLAVLQRLGIAPDAARAVFGEEAWILDQGLPPLAWSDQLGGAASLHGRDMVGRVYYSHYSPEGHGPLDRIAATGYQALVEDETLGALVFANPVDLGVAVDFLLENILRDELSGAPGVQRNVFSPYLSELGVAFLAESLPLLARQPYVYLLVLDFARPLEPRWFLVGTIDPGVRPAMKGFREGGWALLPTLPGDAFQVRFPAGGAQVVAVGDDGRGEVSAAIMLYDDILWQNRSIDLRGLLPGL